MRDPWAAQEALGRTTTRWGAASVVAGLGLAAARRDPWSRAFGVQNAGWGVVDLAIVLVAAPRTRRRKARLPDPSARAALAAESRKLRRVLLVNVALDVGYVAGGAALWRWRRDHPAASGASAGIVVQGAFLLLHDALHAARLGGAATARADGGPGASR